MTRVKLLRWLPLVAFLMAAPALVMAQFGIEGGRRSSNKMPLHAHRDINDGGKILAQDLEWPTGTGGTLGTIAYTDVQNSWSAQQTFSNGIVTPGAIDGLRVTSVNSATSYAEIYNAETAASTVSTFQLPSTAGGSSTLAVLEAIQTWGVLQRFYDNSFKLVDNGDTTKTAVVSLGGASAGADLTLEWSGTADRTVTLPDTTGTLAVLGKNQTWTGFQSFGSNISITGFGSATHAHTSTATGGTLSTSAIASGTLGVARGGTGTTTSTGTGSTVLSNSPSLTSPSMSDPTITGQPTISDYTLGTHSHQNSAGGGVLSTAAITSGAAFAAGYVWEGTCKITSSVTRSSTALTDVTGMSLTVAANTYYMFEYFVPWSSNATANGITLAVTCPSSPTLISYGIDFGYRVGSAATTAGMYRGDADASATALAAGTVITVDRINMAYVHGILVNGANAGTVQLQYAGEDGANTSKVWQGAFGRLTKMP